MLVLLSCLWELLAFGSALSVSPTHFELEGSAGQSVEQQLVIYNSAKTAQKIQLYTGDFWYDKNNQRTFPDAGTSRYSAARWLTIKQTQLDIPAKSQVPVPFVFAVPATAPASGYATIFVEQDSSSGKKHGSVGVSLRIAVPLLFRKTGLSFDRVTVKSFSIQKPTRFEPMVVKFLLANDEEQYVFPEGNLLIVRKDKKEFVAKSDLKKERVVLPHQRIQMEMPVGIDAKPGKYEGMLTLYYGNNASSVRSFDFNIP